MGALPYLKEFSTKELVEELRKREGVETRTVSGGTPPPHLLTRKEPSTILRITD